MSRKRRYIRTLTEAEKEALQAGKKSNNGYQFNNRCHAILLSDQGYITDEIAEIFDCQKKTIYDWFDRFESGGVSALKNKSGQGRKPTLCTNNQDHVKAVDKAVKKAQKRGTNLLLEIEQELDLEEGLSMKMLRTFLKKLVTYGNVAVEPSQPHQTKH